MATKRTTRNRSSLLPEPGTETTATNLNPKQAKFVDGMATGLRVKDAMEIAGMKPNDGTGNALMKTPKVADAIRAEQRKNAYMLGLTRDKVLQGMMDAIDQAKILSDPLTQIAGWREVAKVCGFYAPEVKKVELSGANKAVVDRLRSLSDEELLQIANGDVIDAEYTEIPHTQH